MTRGWDRWVWPLSMSDRAQPEIVEKVCHAVALDDERHTSTRFSSRSDRAPGPHRQGGGSRRCGLPACIRTSAVYPDDSLAHVPLLSIAEEAVQEGTASSRTPAERMGGASGPERAARRLTAAVSAATTATTRGAFGNRPTIVSQRSACPGRRSTRACFSASRRPRWVCADCLARDYAVVP